MLKTFVWEPEFSSDASRIYLLNSIGKYIQYVKIGAGRCLYYYQVNTIESIRICCTLNVLFKVKNAIDAVGSSCILHVEMEVTSSPPGKTLKSVIVLRALSYSDVLQHQ